MPILESMQAKVPLVCSDIDIMREVAGEYAWFADPMNEDSIAAGLSKAVGSSVNDKRIKESTRILSTFSWEAAAESFLQGFTDPIKKGKPTKVRPIKIAVVGPTPEGISAVGKFLQEHYSYMGDSLHTDYYLEDSPSVPSHKREFITFIPNCFDIGEFFKKAHKYKVIIYHIGNSDFHLYSTRLALSIPGIVILHDTCLDGLWWDMSRAEIISENRLKLEAYIDSFSDEPNLSRVSSIVKNAKHVIVHSEHSKKAIESLNLGTPVSRLQHPIPYYRTKLLLNTYSNKYRVVGLGGILTTDKSLSTIGLLLNDDRFNNVAFRIFGHKTVYDGGLVDQYGLNPRVSVKTNITNLEYVQELEKVDVVLNYRQRYRGEASRATIEAMRLGKISIVRDVGWFSELPDDVVIKVKAEEDIPNAILKVINNDELLNKIKRAASDYIEKEFKIDTYIKAIIDIAGKIDEAKH